VPDPTTEQLHSLVARLTLEEKVGLLTGRDSWTMHALPSIGLRSIVMSDGPAGVRGPRWDERSPSCNFPSPTAVAASWDRDRVRGIGRGLGSEARRKQVDVVLAPTINIQRSPYGGRHFEAFSEDPLLTSELATEYVSGIQEHGVAATVKHYVANDSETDRFIVDVRVDERALREVYLLAFESPIVNGGSWLVMSAYNSINGATASENPLLTTPLSDEWGFDGAVVSDWTAVRSLDSARHPQDIVMPGPGGPWGERLVAAVRSGEISVDLIDRKVLRILRLAARVGALAGFEADRTAEPSTEREVRGIARAAAADGMVLMRNDGILPLGTPTRVAVIGEGAAVARTQGGGSATVVPASVVSPLEGIRARWPQATVEWSRGSVVQSGLAELAPGSYRTPDGEPGLLVRYLDEHGSELGREVREASSLVWFDGASIATDAAVVEFAFEYDVRDTGGTVSLGVGGLSDFEVVANGETVARGELRTAPGDDPATAVLNPPFTDVAVPVTGATVDLVVRFRPVPGGIPDSLALKVGLPAITTDAGTLIDDAVRVATEADVAIIVVGTSSEVESEGFDRSSLSLPGAQDELVRAVAAANPRTIVVVNSGAPVTLPWREEVGAVIASWFPGQEFGDALADVLSGDVEPGGRLPVTWPGHEHEVPVTEVTPLNGRLEYCEGIHVGYRAWLRSGIQPAYPFGHGLGYTEWVISELEVDDADPEQHVVSAVIDNVGTRAGKAVVQFYLSRADASEVDRPTRWLAGFETVQLQAGDSTRVDVELPWRRFAHWGDGGWCVEPGEYRVMVGFSVTDLVLSATVTVREAPPAPAVLGAAASSES